MHELLRLIGRLRCSTFDAGIRGAFHVFRSDLARYAAEVLRAVTVPLWQHEFDALVSFHYNTGGIARATLTWHLNAEDRAAAADAFMNWLKPAELRARREAERDLFRHGRYPSGTLPVWSVNADGRVDFSKPLRRLTESEALQLMRPEPVPAAPVTAAVPASSEPVDLPGWLVRLAALFSQILRRA